MLFNLEKWDLVESKVITRTFIFKDFKKALEFINRAGGLAEQYSHHPDIHLVDYKKVKIVLTTHSAGGLTEKDIALAKEIDRLSA